MQHFTRFLLVATLASIGCKSSPEVATDDDNADDESAQQDDAEDDERDDDVMIRDGGVDVPDRDDDDSPVFVDDEGEERDACAPRSCDDQGAECGRIADGCGGTIDCGECAEGEGCGIVQRHICTPLTDLCTPLSQEEACEGKECGRQGDGCLGSYDCGACAGDERCGIVEPSQCDPFPGLGADGGVPACNAATPEEACEGKQCGLVFDGCGTDEENQFDCAELTGGCSDTEYCGLFEAFQCDTLPGLECEGAGSCAALGWECGTAVDACGNVYDCAEEGLSCNVGREVCVGGIDGPTTCVGGSGVGGDDDCELCDAVPVCDDPQSLTRLTGRVITAGKSDDDEANQVAVPNAFVYILRSNDETLLPDVATGIPEGGTSCDRCDAQDLGPILAGATTNALGEYVLEGNIPVGEEFVLVVKLGKWRRAEKMTLTADAACTETALPATLTRLPRSKEDGYGAHIPRIGISTGQIDAMECVFFKMGVAEGEFGGPGADGTEPESIHLYVADGAEPATGVVSHTELHSELERLFSYDMIVFDCQGPGYEDYDTTDENVRQYVNSGGRMFASHLSYTWLYDNGNTPYAAETAVDTGLSMAANFTGTPGSGDGTGVGIVSIDRPRANPTKIQRFADWLVSEDAATFEDDLYTFPILEPRELSSTVNEFSEEFVYREVDDETWVQQFSFNTPYGAPDDALCGRVAYSGFHVSAGGGNSPFAGVTFPEHCDGDLTDQEKVLLYMLFDLGSCVTPDEPPPPACTPIGECTGRCGAVPDGCGGTLECSCPDGEICLPGGVCTGTDCIPTTCEAQGAECGKIADGCGAVLDCGPCPEGQVCGLEERNMCADIPDCPAIDCEDAEAECGVIGDGCGNQVDCGPCPPGEICGIEEAFQCDPPPDCEPLTCEDQDAECGFVSDGCTGEVDCGPCPSGYTCGVEQANKCARNPDDVH